MHAYDAGINLGTGGNFSVNGTLEGTRGPSEFWANSAEFDGSTGYLSKSALSGSVDGKAVSFAFKIKPTSIDSTYAILNIEET